MLTHTHICWFQWYGLLAAFLKRFVHRRLRSAVRRRCKSIPRHIQTKNKKKKIPTNFLRVSSNTIPWSLDWCHAYFFFFYLYFSSVAILPFHSHRTNERGMKKNSRFIKVLSFVFLFFFIIIISHIFCWLHFLPSVFFFFVSFFLHYVYVIVWSLKCST